MTSWFKIVGVGLYVAVESQKSRFAHADGAHWNHNWDSRNGTGCQNRRDILLIPHGDVENSPDPNPSLSALGKSQAVSVGEFLVQEGLHRKIHEVYVANTFRTQETWKHIRGQFEADLPQCMCSMEVFLSDDLPEGLPSIPDPPSLLQDVNANSMCISDGTQMKESFDEHIHRQDPCKNRDTRELYICHPNLIRFFVAKALQFPDTWSRMYISPCGITHLKIASNGNVTLGAFNAGAFFAREQNPLD